MIKNTTEPFPHLFSSDNVSTIIEAAVTTGHISTDNLCLVMAYSGPSLYDDGLSWLLNKYDIEEPDLSTVEGRFTGWKTLFDTWCHGTYDGIHIKTPDGFPLQEAKNLFTRLDLKFPELLFPPQGMTPWLFPELNFEKLSDTTFKWAKKYPFLKQIRLYKNPDQTGSDGKYLLIFETHDQAEYAGTYEGNVFNSRFSEMTVADSDFEKDLKEIYKEGHVPSSNLSTPWCPWIIHPKEPVFDTGYLEPFNKKSGLGEQSNHWTLYGPHYEEVLSDTGKLVENSMLMGRISDGDLIAVLSNEIWFTQKHLPYLWERFGCDSGSRIGDLSRVRYRQNRWMQFLYRIMHGFVRPGVHPKKNHGFDPDLLKSSVKDGVEYINIDDLRAYYMKWVADIPVDEYPVLLRQEPTPATILEPMVEIEPERLGGLPVVKMDEKALSKSNKSSRFIEIVGTNKLTEISSEIVRAHDSTIKKIPGTYADAAEMWRNALRCELENEGYAWFNCDVLDALRYGYSDTNKKRDFTGEALKLIVILNGLATLEHVPSEKECSKIVMKFS